MAERIRRILVVSHAPTHPPTAGNSARILAMMDHLRNCGHDIHFVHLARQPGDNGAMREYWGNRFHSIPFRWPPRGQGRPQDRHGFPYWVWRFIKTRLRGQPFPIADYNPEICLQNHVYSWKKYARALLDFNKTSYYNYLLDEWYRDELDTCISQLKNKNDFDVVLAQYIFCSRSLLHFDDRVLKLIDTHDVFSNRYRQYLENGEEPVFFSCSPADEARALDRADASFAIQKGEQKYLRTLTQKKIIHVGHIVPLHPPTRLRRGHRILFVGSDNSVNVHGARTFLDEAFGDIRSACPEAELVLVGSVCDHISDAPGLIKRGAVPMLDTAYEEADVVINPRRFGTGLSIKSIEAMSWGKPLVSTSAGATGLEDGAGTGFVLADRQTDFKEAIVRLLSDPEYYRKMSDGAYDYACDYNSMITEELRLLLNGEGSEVTA